MLPLVRQIVEDILKTGHRMRVISLLTPPTHVQVREYEQFAETLRDLFEELESLGCTYKDWNFRIGLVDFPSFIYGEEVLLCWRSDELEIGHYHRYQDGYAGRKKIPEAFIHPATDTWRDTPTHV